MAINWQPLAGSLMAQSVTAPPVITGHPQSQTVEPGSRVTFMVNASGTLPLVYQWLRNGQILVPFSQGAATLTISNVQATNAGAYAAMVASSANPNLSAISSNAILNVLGPLTVVESPSSQSAGLGGAATFEVIAAGTPPLFYQWRLNGEFLRDQTNSVLSLSNLHAADGGAFSVIVFNESDAITTGPAELMVNAATGPIPADSFNNRPFLTQNFGVLQGNSALATNEPGEPVAPGGGKSVWFEWIPTGDGVATFKSQGSAFDTLLSVFTGSIVSNLTLVARDDDSGGFSTSTLRFNARHGARYQVMLDGFGLKGSGGGFTVSWALETTADQVPVIVTNPMPRAVPPGGSTTFRVVVDPGSVAFLTAPVSYQWFQNGAPIAGATSDFLTISNARLADVGSYIVVVSNRGGLTAKSARVDLQLNSADEALIQDKFENLYLQLAPAGSGGGGNRPAAGFISIGLGGTIVTNDLYAQPGNQQADPNPCGSPFDGTLWLGLTATNSGTIQVDTIGSVIPSRVAVYKLTGGIGDFNAVPFICDLTNGPLGHPCLAKFSATNGSNYTVVVEGYKTNGLLKLTTKMGIAPPIAASTACLFVVEGGSVQLQMPGTNWLPAPACQWRRNGQPIAGATNATLLLSNFGEAQAGSYSVLMSNFVGMATNVVANVAKAGPFLFGYGLATNNGNTSFVLSGAADMAVVIESASSLPGPWVPIMTNKNPCVRLTFTNSDPLLQPRRFFRASKWFGP